jgi:hypothetical protein
MPFQMRPTVLHAIRFRRESQIVSASMLLPRHFAKQWTAALAVLLTVVVVILSGTYRLKQQATVVQARTGPKQYYVITQALRLPNSALSGAEYALTPRPGAAPVALELVSIAAYRLPKTEGARQLGIGPGTPIRWSPNNTVLLVRILKADTAVADLHWPHECQLAVTARVRSLVWSAL